MNIIFTKRKKKRKKTLVNIHSAVKSYIFKQSSPGTLLTSILASSRMCPVLVIFVSCCIKISLPPAFGKQQVFFPVRAILDGPVMRGVV